MYRAASLVLSSECGIWLTLNSDQSHKMKQHIEKNAPYKRCINGRPHCRTPIFTACIAILCTTLFYLLGAVPEQLIWQQGENKAVWQWITAHFSHISEQHLLWNIAALLILGSIIEQTSRRLLGGALIFGIFGVNLYLALFYDLDAYAGLSGVLNSSLIIALYCLYQSEDYRIATLITLALSILKIILESFMKKSLFSHLPWPPVPEAHLAGLLAGLALIVLLEIRKRRLLNSDLFNFKHLMHKH